MSAGVAKALTRLCFKKKLFKTQSPSVWQICKQEVGRRGRKEPKWNSLVLWQDWVRGIILFKSRLAMSVLHCRNWSLKRDQERKQRDNLDRNRKLGNENKLWRVYLWGERNQRVWYPTQSSGKVNTVAGSQGIYHRGKNKQINFILNEHSLQRNLLRNSTFLAGLGRGFGGLAESLKCSK